MSSLTIPKLRPVALVIAALCCGSAGAFAAGASASDASIKAVIRSYDSKILVAEGHVVTAIGEYKRSGNPIRVQRAIKVEEEILLSLKSKIAAQSASSHRVKLGKAKFTKGLQKIVVAFQHLSKAFGEKKVSPAAAKSQAKKAVTIIKNAHVELTEGARLLG